jgi:hypothetical protein
MSQQAQDLVRRIVEYGLQERLEGTSGKVGKDSVSLELFKEIVDELHRLFP